VTKKSGPPSEFVACDDVASRTGASKLNMVYFGETEGAMHDAFIKVAKETENVMFYHAPADCAAAHGASEKSVAFFRSFDESPVHYEGPAESDSLKAFGDSSSLPTMIEFSEDYIEPIFGKGREALILFSDEKDTAAHAAFLEAAKALKGEILFVQSGTKDGIQSRLAEFVGVDAASAPTVRMLVPGEAMLKYNFPAGVEGISTEAIKSFISDVHSGVT